MNNTPSQKDSLIPLTEVAKRLALSNRSVYRLIAKGSLPKPVKVGGAVRLYESDLETFFETLKAKRK